MNNALAELNIDFMGKRRLAVVFSVTLVLLSILVVAMRGLNFGIDFTGGTLVELGYTKPASIDGIRNTLRENGFDRAVVQNFGSAHDVLVRLAPRGEEDKAAVSNQVVELLRGVADGPVEMRRIEFVGPQIGEELREDGGLALIYALAGILIYVAMRFEYRFSLGSIIALVHDVIITVGFFALTQIEFDLTVLAAVLAVIGYSLNDTIVVFDRIRENFRLLRKGTAEEVVNASINQTLTRTVITSLTTVLVLLALYLFGGEVIRSFSIALIVGIVVGTYSSIYVASNAALMMGITKEDLMPVEKEGELDDRP